jgi:hypothetical protein
MRPLRRALDEDGTGEGMGGGSGEHDRIAAADGPAMDCVVLSSRPEDS